MNWKRPVLADYAPGGARYGTYDRYELADLADLKAGRDPRPGLPQEPGWSPTAARTK